MSKVKVITSNILVNRMGKVRGGGGTKNSKLECPSIDLLSVISIYKRLWKKQF
jgi:hypothetical protein